MKIAIRLAPLSLRHVTHRSGTVLLNKIRRRITMLQIKIALKFSRGLAFGFTLCIIKIIKFNVKFCAKFYVLLRCDLPNGAARRIHHFDFHIRKARSDGIRARKVLFRFRLRALFYRQ